MKRTPLTRKTRMKRGPGPKRRTRVKPSNPARKAKRHAEQFGEHAETIRALPCCVCGAPPPSDPHHSRSRGAGGTAADLVPMCRAHHREAHDAGRLTFERRHSIDLAAVARQHQETT